MTYERTRSARRRSRWVICCSASRSWTTWNLVEVEIRSLPDATGAAGWAGPCYAWRRDRARALGRKRLVGETVQTRPDGAAFAEAIGLPGRRCSRSAAGST